MRAADAVPAAPRRAAVVLAVLGGLATLAGSVVAVQQSGPGPSIGTVGASSGSVAGSLSGSRLGTSGPTLGQWVGQADAVCRSGVQAYATLGRPQTTAQEITYVRSVHAVGLRVDAALRSIPPPAAGGRLVAGMVNSLENETAWVDALAKAMASADQSRQVTAVREVNAAAAAAAQLAQQLGAGDCATMAGG